MADALLILLTLILLALPLAGMWHLLAVRTGDGRLSLALAALAWSAWAVAAAELLPIERGWLLVAWALPAIASLGVLWHGRRVLRARAAAARSDWRRLGGWDRAAWGAIGAIGALTLLTALVAAPNNWDSMVYHLARVEMWAQLGDVAHYPTHIEPQLYQPPGAELLILQGYVISGTDALAALVQWGAWIACVALAHRAAQALGAPARGRRAAAVLVGSAPLAILEATSTQNDLVLTLWLLLALTCAAIAWRRDGDDAVSARDAGWLLLAASLAIGMAVLTKGTGLLFSTPIGVLIAIAAVRRLGVARSALLALAGALLVALPNVGQWSRNLDTYGSIIAAEHAGIDNPYRVQDPDARSLVSNLVRNATNHMDLPFEPANDAIERGTTRLLDSLGIDANDPKTTFLAQPFRVGPFGPHEDHAGSWLLLVLGLWAAGSTLRARRRRETGSGVQLAWLSVLATQVLLFSWLITWQNWHVRMHLPVTLAIAVLIAVRLAARRGQMLLAAVCAAALLASPLYVLLNVTRPLLGSGSILTQSRAATRYEPRPQLRAPHEEVLRRVDDASVDSVGLVTGIDDWQYPLLRELHARGVDVEQVLVTGPSGSATPTSVGDAGMVVCVSCTPAQAAALAGAGLQSVQLEAGGPRSGRGDDVSTVDLWVRDADAG